MFEIIIANFGFWLNLSIPIIIGLYLVITNREYILKEFALQSFATLLYVSVMFALLFGITTDLIDTNYYNSKIQKTTYFEEWKERVTYTETYSCGTTKTPKTCTRTKTRIDYHSPQYVIKTVLGETKNINRNQYLRFKREFGAKYILMNRSNQVSFGDGNKYVVTVTKDIPISMPHSYENYVAAAKSNVIHKKVPERDIKILLKEGKIREYPSKYTGIYGETLLNRVIDLTGKIHKNTLDKMQIMAMKTGLSKQANPIIYITKEPRNIVDAVSQYWNMGKKNDIILFLGVDENGIVQWSDSICFTNNTDFKVDLENDFKGLDVFDDSGIDKVLNTFEKNILNSYIRKPMKEFEYLKENITLEWYWQVLILLGNIIMSSFIAYIFLTNF